MGIIIFKMNECIKRFYASIDAKIRCIESSLKNGEYSHPVSTVIFNCSTNFIKRLRYRSTVKKVSEVNELIADLSEVILKYKSAIRDAICSRYQDIKEEREIRYLIFCVADNYNQLSKTPSGIREFGNVHREELLALRAQSSIREYIITIEVLLRCIKALIQEI